MVFLVSSERSICDAKKRITRREVLAGGGGWQRPTNFSSGTARDVTVTAGATGAGASAAQPLTSAHAKTQDRTQPFTPVIVKGYSRVAKGCPMSELTKIIGLLSAPDRDLRIAAATVLGAIKAKAARPALLALLDQGGAGEQIAALSALAQLQAKSTLKDIVPHVVHERADVRDAAAGALLAFGQAAVGPIEQARHGAPPDKKRALDHVLAKLGGDDAFGALLSGLAEASPEGKREAALEVRRRIKDAQKQERKTYLSQVLKFIKKKDVRADAETLAAAVKMLGYLEDQKAVAPLLEIVKGEQFDSSVRMESIIALRFALQGQREADDVARALFVLLEGEDATLGQVAMDTLANLLLPKTLHARLVDLANTAGYARGRFAIAKLQESDDKAAKTALLKIVADGHPKAAEAAAAALAGEDSILVPLCTALSQVEHAERAVWLTQILLPQVDKLKAPQKKKVLDAALAAAEAGTPGYESLLKAARAIDEEKVAAGLRALADKLRKRKKSDKAAAILSLLERSEHSTVEDKFKLGLLELKKSRLDITPTSRARDASLKIFGEILDEGGDLYALLKKERSLELEHKFYLGFHFIEMGFAVGEELLEEVVKKGGRKKIARAAKNKLRLELED